MQIECAVKKLDNGTNMRENTIFYNIYSDGDGMLFCETFIVMANRVTTALESFDFV